MIRWLPLLLLAAASPAAARLTAAELAGVGTTLPDGARVPPALAFVDQAGRPITFGAAQAGRPAVLLFADFTCTNLCGPGLTLTAGALHDAGLVPGRDYRLIVIGLDPKDGPVRARAMLAERLRGLSDVASSALMLSGDARTIGAATRSLGYRFVYDPALDQFAHDATGYVLDRSGRVSATFAETAAVAPVLKAELARAARGERPAGLAARITALCYGFGAAHGIYGAAVRSGLRVAAVATVSLLVLAIALLARRRRRPA